jgi:hypothetical protein
MESLDAEFSGMPFHLPCGTRHSMMVECPADIEPEAVGMAEAKAAEAKAADVLTPVEKFVASATETNFMLFEKALEEASQMARSCYGDNWIPTGDAQELIQRMDHARNFLALAETYFRAISTPLMQAAHIHIQRQQQIEATAPWEATAWERSMFKPGTQVRITDQCEMDSVQSGSVGVIVEGIDQDGEVLVKLESGYAYYLRTEWMELI